MDPGSDRRSLLSSASRGLSGWALKMQELGLLIFKKTISITLICKEKTPLQVSTGPLQLL